MELQKLFVTLALKADEYKQGLQGAADQAQSFGSRIGGAFGAAGRVATGAMLGIGAAAVGGFGLALRESINMNASLEQSTMQFTTLMGDADMAADHVAMLFEMGAKTPFETGPIIQASKHLQVFGGTALNTQENLLLIGDASAAVGQNFDEVAFWTGRLYSSIQNGQPFGEAAARLGEMGIMAPEVRQKLEELKDSGATGSEIWNTYTTDLEKFGGAMEMQSQSWAGLTSTIKDQLSMAAAEGLEPFFELIQSGLSWLVDSGIIERVGSVFSNFFKLIATAPDEGGPLMDYLQELPTWLQPIGWFLAEVAVAISSFIRNLQEGMSPIDAFIEAIWEFRPSMESIIPKGVLDALVNFRDDILPGLKNAISNIVDPIVTWAKEFFSLKDVLIALGILIASIVLPAIGGIVLAIAPVLLTVAAVIAVVALLRNAWENNWGGIQEKVAAVIGFVVPLIQTGIATIQQWWNTNGAAILAKAQEIFTGIQTAIQTVIGAVIAWWNANWPTIQATIETVWGIVRTVIQTAIDIIKPALEALVANGKEALGGLSGLVEPLQGLWAKIGPFVQSAATLIGGILTTLLGLIVGIVKGISQAIGPLIDTFINLAKNVIEIVGGIIEFFTGFFNLIVGLVTGNTELIEKAWDQMTSGIVSIVTGLVTGVVDLITGLWETLKSLVSGIVEGVVEFFTNLYDELVGHSLIVDLVEDVVTWFESLLEWIGDVLKNLWATVSKPFFTMWEELKGWFNEKIEDIKAIGQSLIDGLIAGIEAGKQFLRDILQGVADLIPDWLKQFLGIASPAQATIPVGQAIVQGIIRGIEEESDEMVGAIEEWLLRPINQMMNGIENLLEGGGSFGGLAQGIAGHFKRLVMDPMEAQMEALSGTVTSAGTIFENVFRDSKLKFADDSTLKTLNQLFQVQGRLNERIANYRARGVGESAFLYELQSLNTVNQAIDAFRMRNDINAEYVRQQEKLLALEKARADLDFLKQQMEMLSLMREYKIPLSALGGVELGLTADPGQLMNIMVDVMERVVRATQHEINSMNRSPAVTGQTPGTDRTTMNIQNQNINGGQHIYLVDTEESELERLLLLSR